tara:strand:+ start:2170 stop:2694 length:525 start_codon:yes stop_codon:yes gene_type:complete
MKINESQLRQIIKEELQAILTEERRRRIDELKFKDLVLTFGLAIHALSSPVPGKSDIEKTKDIVTQFAQTHGTYAARDFAEKISKDDQTAKNLSDAIAGSHPGDASARINPDDLQQGAWNFLKLGLDEPGAAGHLATVKQGGLGSEPHAGTIGGPGKKRSTGNYFAKKTSPNLK